MKLAIDIRIKVASNREVKYQNLYYFLLNVFNRDKSKSENCLSRIEVITQCAEAQLHLVKLFQTINKVRHTFRDTATPNYTFLDKDTVGQTFRDTAIPVCAFLDKDKVGQTFRDTAKTSCTFLDKEKVGQTF
ncbi:hypothetical protein ACJMK2_012340 [Sinanodonta woodiana]|uniref:Uncharacterized protein n=1 Tax=Sinanodonta woodiana TaxID=1069815 RepID=A0ABD3V9F2_SINWO